MIDVRQLQQRLAAKGFLPGPVDGQWGRTTLTAWFAFAAGRQPDAALRALGNQAANPTQGMATYGFLDTPARLADFTAQTANETGGFTVFEENLRYSAKRLMVTWPNRFPTLEAAAPYAWDASDPDREDVALADLIYGSRMGNERNGTNDDDGWNFRGRGLPELTGADNYAHFGRLVGVDLCQHPDMAADPALSLRIACEFWREGQVNQWVDRGDFYAARGITNVGTPHPKQKPIGLDAVAARRATLLAIFN